MSRRPGFVVLSLLVVALALIGTVPPGGSASAADQQFIVTSTLDAVDDAPGDGVCHAAGDVCTLRAAIQESNATVGIDTIVVSAGSYTLTIAGTDDDTAATGDLDITDAAIIVGDGAATTVLDGNALDRVVHVLTADGVAISGVSIQNGSAFSGGGITNEIGLLTLDSVIIQYNASEQGGGIWNAGDLSLSSSAVLENDATDGSGGAIFTQNGVVTLTNVNIENNDALVQGGGVAALGGQITMIGGTISGNEAVFAGGGGILAFSVNVSLTGVNVLGNSGFGAALSSPSATAGGVGVYDGALEIYDSQIEGNYIYGSGGGIFVSNSAFTIDGGRVSDNTARFGGGIFGNGSISNISIDSNYVEATFGEAGAGGGINGGGTLTNVTISSNVVENGDEGSDVFAARGTAIYGSATLVNVTIADNATASIFGPDPIAASPIYATGTMELANTIVADPSPLGCAGDPVSSLGHNLDRGTTCGFAAAGDQSGVDPLLGPLADNGGLSPTHALLPDSPAIDAGDDTICPAIDQRSLARPVDGNADGLEICDIGAYEVQADDVPDDMSAPTITPEISGTLGLNGWYVSDVTLSWSLVDDESTISATNGCEPTTITADTAGTTLTCVATSAGGTAEASVTIKRDTTAPTITANSDIHATATSRAGAVVSYSAPAWQDALSGNGTASCPLRSGRRFSLGETAVNCLATDAAGNAATSSFRVFVTYSWTGIRPPANPNGPTVINAGSTIPLKFRLTGASAGITNALAKLSAQRLSDGTRLFRDAVFHYDADEGYYLFRWRTIGLAPGDYKLTIDLGDGDTTRTFIVTLR